MPNFHSSVARRAGPQWKPTRCACGARHPSFNRDAGKPGTAWRCRDCDAIAEPMPPADPFAGPGNPTEGQQQGALL